MSAPNLRPSPPIGHAVVIGGSVAGLVAARVLADHAEVVTILERDEPGDDASPRKGVPQGRHVHALLMRGHEIMEGLLPGLTAWMVERGALRPNMGRDAAWYLFGAFRPRYDSGLSPLSSSRPLLELGIRHHVLQNPKITLLTGCELTGYLTDERREQVRGVRFRDSAGERSLAADLVVDASGRGSRTPRLLEELGLTPPEETVVTSRAAYSTRIYRLPRDPGRDWQLFYIQPAPGQGTRGGIAAPIEGDRFVVTLIGMAGDHPPKDEEGFLAFADSLPAPGLAAALRGGTPLSPIYTFARAENRLRHYDKLPRYLDGLVALGDAVYALNPVYGQGMTVAAIGAHTLGETIRARTTRDGLRKQGLSRHFQRELASVVALPWQMATGEDVRWPIPENEGRVGLGARVLSAYMDMVQRASLHDPVVTETFYRVAQMLDAPTVLFRPGFLLRVLRSGRASGPRALPAPVEARVRAA